MNAWRRRFGLGSRLYCCWFDGGDGEQGAQLTYWFFLGGSCGHNRGFDDDQKSEQV